jgi:hypothetical protein
MKRALFGALLAMTMMATQASTTRDLESSAVVNGTIVLGKDGSVQVAVIDDEAKVGRPIADMVRKTALQWRFQPVLRNGEPVLAKASMHARVILKKTTDGNYTARVKGATFGDEDMKSTDDLHRVEGDKNPSYPETALRSRVQGTVYVALQVDRLGHVSKAVAEQVDLGNTGPDHLLAQYRNILAQATLEAVHKWTFQIPTTGRLASQNSWSARIPVHFQIGEAKTDRVWETYVPGPYIPAPWVDKPDANAADAIADGGMRTDGTGPTLLSQTNHD